MESRVRCKGTFINAAIFFAAGLIVLSCFGYDRFNGERSLQFATVKGTIREASPQYNLFSKRKSYFLHIKYTYEVDGKTFESQRISYPDPGAAPKSETEKYLSNYPVAHNVKVFFDQRYPENAVLIRGTQSQIVQIALMVGMFLLSIVAAISPGQKHECFYLDKNALPAWVFNIIKADK